MVKHGPKLSDNNGQAWPSHGQQKWTEHGQAWTDNEWSTMIKKWPAMAKNGQEWPEHFFFVGFGRMLVLFCVFPWVLVGCFSRII